MEKCRCGLRQWKSDRQIIRTDSNQHPTTRNQQQTTDRQTRQPATNNKQLLSYTDRDTPDNQKPKLDNQRTSTGKKYNKTRLKATIPSCFICHKLDAESMRNFFQPIIHIILYKHKFKNDKPTRTFYPGGDSHLEISVIPMLRHLLYTREYSHGARAWQGFVAILSM
jgi:hypothetical protein